MGSELYIHEDSDPCSLDISVRLIKSNAFYHGGWLRFMPEKRLCLFASAFRYFGGSRFLLVLPLGDPPGVIGAYLGLGGEISDEQ